MSTVNRRVSWMCTSAEEINDASCLEHLLMYALKTATRQNNSYFTGNRHPIPKIELNHVQILITQHAMQQRLKRWYMCTHRANEMINYTHCDIFEHTSHKVKSLCDRPKN